MIPVILISLFVIQIIGFYFLALVYTKVSKFDDLEKKQKKLMAEMDDSIVAYLSELKDENDRLIEQLTRVEVKPISKEPTMKSSEGSLDLVEESPSENLINIPKLPINLALKSYSAASLYKTETEPKEAKEIEKVDVRTKALRLYDTGQSIEEIAKTLGKGRTEIELILKFR